MTLTLDLVLLIIAAICFAIAALGFAPHPRVNLIALGLFCWVATLLV
jgi:hypothetical protein